MADKKYTIDLGDGNPPAEITVEGGWATEDTLSAIATKLKAKSDLFSTTEKDVKKALDPKVEGSFTHTLNIAEKEVEEFEQGLTKTQKGLAVLSLALGASRDVAAGVLKSTGKLTDINPIVENVIGQVGRFAKTVFGAVPVVGDMIENFGQLSMQIINLTTNISQRVLDTFDTLSQKGVGSAFAFDDLGQSLAKAKITQEDFTRALAGSNQGLVALGGDLERGAQRFLDTVGIANDEFRTANRAIGLSTMEVSDFIAKFIESEKDGLLQNTISNRNLAKFTTIVNRNLSVLAELTGKDVDRMREEFLVNNMAIGAKISLAKAERDGAEGVVSAFKLVEDFLPTVLQPFVAQSVKFDAAIGDIAPLNVFGTLIQDLNTDLDNLRTSSMTFEERQNEAAKIVQRAFNNIEKATDGSAAGLAEFAGVIPSDVLEQFARITMSGIKEQARAREFIDAGIPGGDERLQYFDDQIQKTQEVIEAAMAGTEEATSALGAFASTAIEIENATSEFTERLLDMTFKFLPEVVDIIRFFYKRLGDSLENENLSNLVTDPGKTIFGVNTFSPEEIEAIKNRTGYDVTKGPFQGTPLDFIPSPMEFIGRMFRQNGGSTMAGGNYIVGEAGPELLTMGSTNGFVSSNRELSSLMGGIAEAIQGPIDTARQETTMMANAGASDTRMASALSNTTLTTKSPEMQKELESLNRNLKRLLPQALTSNGVY
jgi:hypothetical protein